MAMPADPYEHEEPPAASALANDEAEQSLLGAILADNAAYDRVTDILAPEHFADGVHARIFEACGKLISRGERADAIRLKGFFDEEEALLQVGGARYLAELQANFVTMLNARDYAATIRECWLRRQLVDLAGTMGRQAYTPDLDTEIGQVAEAAADRLTWLLEASNRGGGLEGLRGLLRGVTQETEDIRNGRVAAGMASGLADLDRALGGGLRPGLIILAARPSMGKSALAGCVARYVASRPLVERDTEGHTTEQPQPVAFFSLEMSAEEATRRIICERAGLEFTRSMQPDGLTEAEWERFIQEGRDQETLPLFIDDTAALTPAAIYSRALGLKRRHGLALVIVDYLQLMTPPDTRGNRTEQVSALTRALKDMSKRLGVPVVALSQLSRAVEQRENKRPMMADLRESGSIEQDADVILFLYREEYYLQRGEPTRREGEEEKRFLERLNDWSAKVRTSQNVGEIIISKARHGRTQTVKACFEARTMRWSDLAYQQNEFEGI